MSNDFERENEKEDNTKDETTEQYLISYALSIIANVDGGNWDKQSSEWNGAAKKWFDSYKAWLKEDRERKDEFNEWMLDTFDDRQMGLINDCNVYANGDPSGLPGHNIMIIVSKLHTMLKEAYEYIK